MDFFFFKKIIGALIMPLPIIILLLILAVYFSLKHHHRKSLSCLIIGLTALVVTSYSPLPKALLKPLERQYAQFDESQQVDFIVVLGCQHVNDQALPITAQVSPCSSIRAIEALRILQFNPEAKIITSGNVGREAFSNAHMTKQLLVALGVSENRVIQIELSKDTAEEALNLRDTLGNNSFALVTSATHMKRAVILFKQQGLDPIAAPTEHLVRESDQPGIGHYFPSSKNLYHFERWWYEWMGNTWVWLTQWFD